MIRLIITDKKITYEELEYEYEGDDNDSDIDQMCTNDYGCNNKVVSKERLLKQNQKEPGSGMYHQVLARSCLTC
jgi:hypothetical protein